MQIESHYSKLHVVHYNMEQWGKSLQNTDKSPAAILLHFLYLTETVEVSVRFLLHWSEGRRYNREEEQLLSAGCSPFTLSGF